MLHTKYHCRSCDIITFFKCVYRKVYMGAWQTKQNAVKTTFRIKTVKLKDATKTNTNCKHFIKFSEKSEIVEVGTKIKVTPLSE